MSLYFPEVESFQWEFGDLWRQWTLSTIEDVGKGIASLQSWMLLLDPVNMVIFNCFLFWNKSILWSQNGYPSWFTVQWNSLRTMCTVWKVSKFISKTVPPPPQCTLALILLNFLFLSVSLLRPRNKCFCFRFLFLFFSLPFTFSLD